MNNIDISILKEKPLLDMKVQLIIEPLAPLSMVAELPGSYYKSLMHPSKKMICGLFENILGWHFDINTRMAILKDLKKIRKKQKIDVDYKSFSQGSTYVPLLMEYFELGDIPQIYFEELCFYDDMWARSHTSRDTPSEHYKKCRNINPSSNRERESKLNEIEKDDRMNTDEKKEAIKKVNESYKDKYPFFHPALPTKREYIFMKNGSYTYNALFDKRMYSVLKEKLYKNNIAYLGNSEGWINIELE